MEKINLNDYLASNEYPGRGIAVAMAPDGRQMFIGYPVVCPIFFLPKASAVRPIRLTILSRTDRKSTRLNSSHVSESRMPSSA